MKEKLAKLVNVKSIVTLIICGVFAYLSIIGQIMPDQFLTIFTVIISCSQIVLRIMRMRSKIRFIFLRHCYLM